MNKTDLQALNLSGIYCHKTSTRPPSCQQPTIYESSGTKCIGHRSQFSSTAHVFFVGHNITFNMGYTQFAIPCQDSNSGPRPPTRCQKIDTQDCSAMARYFYRDTSCYCVSDLLCVNLQRPKPVSNIKNSFWSRYSSINVYEY